jgi:predicted component of type VI protein secretion system
LYLQHYERLSEAAREDFQELFGRAFVKAYEEQADRIAAARKSSR